MGKGCDHCRHSLLGKPTTDSDPEIMNRAEEIKQMNPYMPSEISVLMDDETQLLFPGKRALQHSLSGKDDAVFVILY